MQESATGDSALATHTYVGGLNVRNENSDGGLLLMGHRWYDASLGRFLTRDPIGFRGGFNQYAYVRNPTTYNDPFGLTPIVIHIGEGASLTEDDLAMLQDSYSKDVGACADSIRVTSDMMPVEGAFNVDVKVDTGYYLGPDKDIQYGTLGTTAYDNRGKNPLSITIWMGAIDRGLRSKGVSQTPCAERSRLILNAIKHETGHFMTGIGDIDPKHSRFRLGGYKGSVMDYSTINGKRPTSMQKMLPLPGEMIKAVKGILNATPLPHGYV